MENLIDLAAEAARTFRRYEVSHRAKNTADSLAKAEVNAALALRIETALEERKTAVELLEYFTSCEPSGIEVMSGDASRKADEEFHAMCLRLRKVLGL